MRVCVKCVQIHAGRMLTQLRAEQRWLLAATCSFERIWSLEKNSRLEISCECRVFKELQWGCVDKDLELRRRQPGAPSNSRQECQSA